MGLCLLAAGAARAATRLELRHRSVELPGAPATIVAGDVDGDGRGDLAVVVVYTAWDQQSVEQESHMEGVDGLVEMLTVVPFLADRRELWLLRGTADGDFERAADPLPLPASVVGLEPGTPGAPIVALTDDGVAALRFVAGAPARLELEPLVAEPSLLAHSGTLVPNLGIARDLDRDGRADLLLPDEQGAAVVLATAGGPASIVASRLVFPDLGERRGAGADRHLALPEARDLDGDGLPELLLVDPDRGWDRLELLRNLGAGRFAPAIGVSAGALGRGAPARHGKRDRKSIVYLGDLDGDGRAEYVTQEDLEDEDAGFRKEMRQAKTPPRRYRVHAMRADFSMAPEATREFEADGYAFEGGDEIRLPGGFQDLNGDGRLDLVTLTLDFSLFQIVRVLATHSFDLGLDFHVYCQSASGEFRPVAGLDLAGKFHLDLDNLKIGQLSQFAGDFDGDGRADFVQIGRGRTVTIHRGGEDCSFPTSPDLKIELAEAPRDLALVEIRDLDGDGRSDLAIVQPEAAKEAGVTPPVRLELYLSGGRP